MPSSDIVESQVTLEQLNEISDLIKEIADHYDDGDSICIACDEVWFESEVLTAWTLFQKHFMSMSENCQSHLGGISRLAPRGFQIRKLAQAEVALERFKKAATDDQGAIHKCFEVSLPQILKGWREVLFTISQVRKQHVAVLTFGTGDANSWARSLVRVWTDQATSWAEGLPNLGGGDYQLDLSNDAESLAAFAAKKEALQRDSSVLTEWSSLSNPASTVPSGH